MGYRGPPSPGRARPGRSRVAAWQGSPSPRAEHAGLIAWPMVADTYTRAAAWLLGSLRVGSS